MARRAIRADYEIDAMAREAQRRGISYGNLVAATTPEERERIAEEYLAGAPVPARTQNRISEAEDLEGLY